MSPEIRTYCLEYAQIIAEKQTEFLRMLRASIEKGEISPVFARQCVRVAQINEDEANARLIAAAPELLDAVNNMMHDLNILYAKHREPGNEYLAALKAAVLKAEGA